MKRIKLFLLLFMTTFFAFNIGYVMSNTFADQSDPLVTQSYVDEKIDEIKSYFDGKLSTMASDIATLKANTQDSTSNTANSAFVPVTVKLGSKLIAGAGTEIVLRAGNANAIASVEGGILDTTGGVDLQSGKEVTKQHLLIVPRDDGRGIIVTGKKDAVLLVRGSYKIK